MKRIDTNTTESEILEQVAQAKQALIKFATEAAASDSVQGERLVNFAQGVASAEALASVQIQYLNAIKRDPSSAVFVLAEFALQNDDTSSGRQNDSRRASHDTVAAWVREELLAIRYS